MTDHLRALGEVVADAQIDGAVRRAAQVDALIRCSLACVGFGALTEADEVPSFLWDSLASRPGRPTVRDAMAQAEAFAILGAASDLDPMDRGPAHVALPAAVAALVAAQRIGSPADAVADAVAVGVECGTRLRQAVLSVRPGVGFHSASTFGLFGAAAAVARLLRLDAVRAADAIAIALTRAGGLAVNNAMTRIGLTHFGKAAAHGLEAAWLASEGWPASHNLESAFGTLFGGTYDFSVLSASELVSTARPAAFKHYPCNIYVNLAILAFRRLPPDAQSDGRLTLVLPPVRHLDNPRPADLRQARNSAQAALAAIRLYGPTYRAFSAAVLRCGANSALEAQMDSVEVSFDEARSTGLSEATVDVLHGDERAAAHADELGPWGLEHALALGEGLVDPQRDRWLREVFTSDYLQAFHSVADLATAAQGVPA